MPRYGRIAVQPEWSAEYEMSRDGDVTLTQIECDGESIDWCRIPDCIDRMLVAAARAEEAQRIRDLPGEIADIRIQERKDGEAG